jgi:branched-chain amino acid transport system permease protein
MSNLHRAVRLGLIGGLAMSFVGAIGMVDKFDDRLLIDPFLTLGMLVLFGIPVAIGVLVARGEPNPLVEPERDPAAGAVSGLLAGAIAGIVTALYTFLIDGVSVQQHFPNMSPQMVDALTFGLGVPTGLLALAGGAAIAGALGGAAFGLADTIRHGLARAVGWVLGFALLESLIDDMFEFAEPVVDLIYTPLGVVRWLSAIVIGVLAWFLHTRFRGQGRRFTAAVGEADSKSNLRRGVIVVVALAVLILPQLLGGILNELMINVALFILMGLGLNIVVGHAGLLDLGYVAFFAVGAYGTAVLTSPLSPTVDPLLNWWVALPIVLVFAVIAGILVGTPVIRMRGDYLAIVTLGFGEIVRILLLSDWLTPIFGGAQGIRRIPGIQVPGMGTIGGTDPELFVYFTMFFVGIAAYISYRAQESRVGRAWAAMREDEDVAEAIGVNTVQSKLLAFVTGAVIASFAGALFSAKVGTVFTNSFDVLVSIIILVVVIVGGMGSIPGVMVGALVLIGILGGPKSPGLLQEMSEYKLLIYGALLVYMMLKRPEGLLPSVRRTRELHGEEMAQDAWLDKGGEPVVGEREEAAV